METKTNLVEPILEKVEAYTQTSFEIIRLKELAKTADAASTLFSRSLFTIMVSLFIFTVNIAIALWLGDLLGKLYYGFLVIAGCYALAAVILLIVHPFIKKRFNNAIIKQLFN